MTTETRNDEQQRLATRRQEFETMMDWVRAKGGFHVATLAGNKPDTMQTYVFAGQILIVSEIVRNGVPNWEFFMPVTTDGTWEGTRAALRARLEDSKR